MFLVLPLAEDHVSSVSQIGRWSPWLFMTWRLRRVIFSEFDGRPLNGCTAATSKRPFTPALYSDASSRQEKLARPAITTLAPGSAACTALRAARSSLM